VLVDAVVGGGGIFTAGTSFIGLCGFAGVLGGSISLVGLVPILLSPGVLTTDVGASGIASTLFLKPSTGLTEVLRETDGAVLGIAGIDEEKVIAIGVVAGAVLGTEGVMRGREMLGLNGVFILLKDKPIGVRLAVLGEKEKVVGGV
jgi:hypothetical protein